MAKKIIALTAITMDGSTQMRARMDDEFIDELAELYKGEHEIPPPKVFWDGEAYWLGDGHHRVSAARKAELKGLEVVVIQGTHKDAILFACSANDDNGLRRTTADKRKAIRTLLEDKLWKTRSDRWLAQTCKVSGSLVASIRESLNAGAGTGTSTRTGADGKEYKPKPKTEKADKSKNGQPEFDHQAFFSSLNALRRSFDKLYRIHGLVSPDGSIKRDADWEAMSRILEGFVEKFESRWLELAKTPFPKQ